MLSSEMGDKMKLRTLITAFLCLVGLIIGELDSAAQMVSAELSPKQLGEFLAGIAGEAACIGMILLSQYLVKPGQNRQRTQELPLLEDPPLGFVMGTTALCAAVFALGSSTGVYVVGIIGDETGSFLATLAGAAVGAVLPNGCCLGLYIRGKSVEADEPAGAALGMGFAASLIFAPIAAMIGFNRTRRYESSSALDSHAAPSIYFDLLKVRF